MTECTSYYIVCTCLTSVVVVGLSRALSYRNLSRQPPDSSFYVPLPLLLCVISPSFAHFLTFLQPFTWNINVSSFVTPSSHFLVHIGAQKQCKICGPVYVCEICRSHSVALSQRVYGGWAKIWCDMIWMWEKRLIRNYLSNNVTKKGRCF